MTADLSAELARRRVNERLFGRREDRITLGPYAILHELGRGGQGIVYRALDREAGRPCALKLLGTHAAANLKRFKAEFRSLRELCHPNIVRVGEDLHRQKSRWFFSMELIEGTDFVSHVRGARPDRRASLLHAAFVQLVGGIRAIHRARRLHRDLKPSNVYVDSGGRVIIIDFGLVGRCGRDGRARDLARAGTPAYMAPEQARGEPASEASDWYAAGVMLYEGLFGQRPTPDGVAALPRHAHEGAGRNRFSALAAIAADLLQNDPLERLAADELFERLIGTRRFF